MVDIQEWTKRARSLEAEAHEILSSHEAGRSRIVSMNATKARLDKSSVQVRQSFGEAVTCLEHGLHRSAVVMSWSGFFFQFLETFWDDHRGQLMGYSGWKVKQFDDLLLKGDAEILTAAERLGFIDRNVRRNLDGRLAKRNLCAHPSAHIPSLNQAIGFVDEMISEAINRS